MRKADIIGIFKKASVLIIGTLCYIVLIKLSRGNSIEMSLDELIYFSKSLAALSFVATLMMGAGYKIDQLFTQKEVLLDKPLKRVILTTLLAWIGTTGALLLVWMVSFKLLNLDSELRLYDTLIRRMAVFNYQFLVSLFYISYVYMDRVREYERSSVEENGRDHHNSFATHLTARSKGTNRLLEVDKVVFFSIKDGVIFAHTADGKKHMMVATTLMELEKQLNPDMFFRINRAELLNQKYVASFKNYRKDRLVIQLNALEESLMTSNARSSGFRKWVSG